jgi:hypothetical protein
MVCPIIDWRVSFSLNADSSIFIGWPYMIAVTLELLKGLPLIVTVQYSTVSVGVAKEFVVSPNMKANVNNDRI